MYGNAAHNVLLQDIRILTLLDTSLNLVTPLQTYTVMFMCMCLCIDSTLHTHSQDFQKGGYTDVYACINIQNYRGLKACSPGNVQKLDAQASEAFWNRSRTIVAAWPAEYCIQFLDEMYHMYC